MVKSCERVARAAQGDDGDDSRDGGLGDGEQVRPRERTRRCCKLWSLEELQRAAKPVESRVSAPQTRK